MLLLNMANLLFRTLFLATAAFLISSCTDDKGSDSSSSSTCTSVTDTLGSPKTIDDMMNLINALPRPLSLECFLVSLKAPLNIFAVNSTFSAQPAVDQNSPRIFILQNKLVLSVAPAGVGRNLLEFSELNGTIETFKGEIEFPIDGTVTADSITKHISQTSTTSTCVTCHTSERKVSYGATGSLYVSKILRPNEAQRVTSSYLKTQATDCNPSINKHRCEVLNAIFVTGQGQDASFPF